MTSFASIDTMNKLAFKVMTRKLRYFPPRFCSRKRTFFRTIVDFVSAPLIPLFAPTLRDQHVPTGSYFSMLSGRWVLGRMSVLK